MTKRNYRREYDEYHSKPKQIRNRNSRNKARAKLGLVNNKKYQNYDVHHKNGDPTDNKLSNLEIVHKSKNRSMNQI